MWSKLTGKIGAVLRVPGFSAGVIQVALRVDRRYESHSWVSFMQYPLGPFSCLCALSQWTAGSLPGCRLSALVPAEFAVQHAASGMHTCGVGPI